MAKRFIDAEKMREEWLENGENEYVYDTNAVLDSIDAQPTADVVEVVYGKWIHKVKKYLYQPDSCTAICSVCGSTYGLDPEYTIEWFAKDNKFCSNCGAKMDLGVTE